eukprot:TRINITY_DN51282_c0_g1_i2.p1 TRINITY_DN51282_c0_g1~~TRINITY_DN51282_c0_g1_i2.p1  ORF type:complete len:354 (-),score=73.14 TRINITY_DN51282_c0_g1_i2:55-1116(-)
MERAEPAVGDGTSVENSKDGSGVPVALVEGTSTVTFKVFASSTYKRRYKLDGCERISWDCRILDDLDVVMSTNLACDGLQTGTERSREVVERERSAEFTGFLDLGAEHKGWLSDLGAASADGAASHACLSFDFDNSYSWFTPKTVQLTLKKVGPSLTSRAHSAGEAPQASLDLRQRFAQALEDCRAEGQWELSLRLLGRMRQASVPPDVSQVNTAMDVCGRSGHWAHALGLLQRLRAEGPSPTPASFNIVISACESSGNGEMALHLMDDMEEEKRRLEGTGWSPRVDRSNSEGGSTPGAEDAVIADLKRLRGLLQDVIPRCPGDAPDLLGSLATSLGSLERYLDNRPCATSEG